MTKVLIHTMDDLPVGMIHNDIAVLNAHGGQTALPTCPVDYKRPIAPVRLTATCDVTIPPHTAAFRVGVTIGGIKKQAAWRGSVDGIAEGTNRSIITLTDGVGSVPLWNRSSHAMVLPKGTQVGAFMPWATETETKPLQGLFERYEAAYAMAAGVHHMLACVAPAERRSYVETAAEILRLMCAPGEGEELSE